MPSLTPVTAVFDIGKTNKKFFLFDENYSVVEKYHTELEQKIDDDGDPCEDLEKLETWIKKQIRGIEEKGEFHIQALNFSAYGASLVHLDKRGKVATPLYNYLKPYPEELLSEFYEKNGGKKEFSLQTASPPMGMLNSGLQLYWLKHEKPDFFKRIETSLHFPQYLSYLFSGKKICELTSIGCHTSLWNSGRKNYHNWLEKNDLLRLLPKIKDTSGTFGNATGVRIGPGIHDSSAALVPYLLGLDEPFILVSTGTWSITLNPFNKESLTYEELQRDCLCYLDINGNQVKASRLFLGSEYAHQKKKIDTYFGIPNREERIELDVSLLNTLIQKKNSETKLQLEKGFNSGPFPQNEPEDWQVQKFSTRKEAYHQLMLDLVTMQAESIKLAQGSENIDRLIITGGFSQNEFFVKLLASFFPEKKVCTSLIPDASALGAALVINQPLITEDFKRLLGLNLHSSLKGLNIEQYSWRK